MPIVLNGTTGITTPDVDSTADISANGLTVGRGAGAVSTNTAVGASALAANTTGAGNTSVGFQAGFSNTTGKESVAFGKGAGLSQTTAVSNCFIGTNAGGGVTTGGYNTFIGSGETGVTAGAGEFVTTGSKNTILGRYSGNQGGLDIRTSSNNIVLSGGDGNPRLQFGVQGTNASGWRLFGASHNNSNAITCGEALQILSEDNGSSIFGVLINFNAATYGSASNIRFFNRSTGSVVGTITSTTTSTSYVTSSDYRLKHDIQPMTGALARVAALKPVTYKWNTNDLADEGFIAHELAEVCPSAVSGEKDAVETYTDEDGVEQTRIKPQGIDTSFLAGLYAAAIQELKAINDAQAQTIESLTARVVALEQA